jgi:hypothetical protein
VWRACERFALLPPGVRQKWDDNSVMTQAELLSYDQIRQMEEIDAIIAGSINRRW